jgi:hypothetical protein
MEIKFLCGVGIENVDVVDLYTAKHIKNSGLINRLFGIG